MKDRLDARFEILMIRILVVWMRADLLTELFLRQPNVDPEVGWTTTTDKDW